MPSTPPAAPPRPHPIRALALRMAGLYVVAGLAWMVGAHRGGGLLATAVALIFALAFVASAASPALVLERRWIRASMACALASFLAAWVLLLAIDAIFSPPAMLGCRMHEVAEGGIPDAVCLGPLPFLFSSGVRAWFLLPTVAIQAATTAFAVAVAARGVRLAVLGAARLAGWRPRRLPRRVARAVVLLGWIVPGALLAASLVFDPVLEARAERREAAAETARRNRGPSATILFRSDDDSLEVGDDERLVAWALYSKDGSSMSQALDSVRLDFASLAPRVASVDSAGLLHALAPGTARITVTAHALGGQARLAEGKADTMVIRVAPPNAALRGLRFVSVSASPLAEFGATCAVGADGAAYCWGYSIGDGAEEDDGPRTFTRVAGPEPFAAVSVGGFHRCAVARSGRGYCWGENSAGELGIGGRRGAANAPSPVAGGRAWRQISAGWRHTCGIDVAGALFCWGSDRFGQLAPAAVATRCPSSIIGIERSRRDRWRCALQPAAILARMRFLEVGVGTAHTCALAVDGAVWCWGDNYNHQSSPAAAEAVAIPTRIPFPPMAHLAAGSRHNCGVATGGRLMCWGYFRYGETPDEDPGRGPRRPLPVDSAPAMRTLAAGESHGCGIAVDERAYCWGSDFEFELGRGVTRQMVPSAAAVPVAGGLRFQSIAAGKGYTCGVTVRGGLYCWGLGLSFRFAGGNRQEIPQPLRLAGPPG